MEPNLTFLLAAVSCLVGGGVGWGTVRASLSNTVKRIESSATKLETVATDVTTLKTLQTISDRTITDLEDRTRILEIEVATLKARLNN